MVVAVEGVVAAADAAVVYRAEVECPAAALVAVEAIDKSRAADTPEAELIEVEAAEVRARGAIRPPSANRVVLAIAVWRIVLQAVGTDRRPERDQAALEVIDRKPERDREALAATGSKPERGPVVLAAIVRKSALDRAALAAPTGRTSVAVTRLPIGRTSAEIQAEIDLKSAIARDQEAIVLVSGTAAELAIAVVACCLDLPPGQRLERDWAIAAAFRIAAIHFRIVSAKAAEVTVRETATTAKRIVEISAATGKGIAEIDRRIDKTIAETVRMIEAIGKAIVRKIAETGKKIGKTIAMIVETTSPIVRINAETIGKMPQTIDGTIGKITGTTTTGITTTGVTGIGTAVGGVTCGTTTLLLPRWA